MEEDDRDAEEKAAGLVQTTAVAMTEATDRDMTDFQNQMKDRLKGKSDCFSQMMELEEKIRLGEDGWKARYYEVGHYLLIGCVLDVHQGSPQCLIDTGGLIQISHLCQRHINHWCQMAESTQSLCQVQAANAIACL